MAAQRTHASAGPKAGKDTARSELYTAVCVSQGVAEYVRKKKKSLWICP